VELHKNHDVLSGGPNDKSGLNIRKASAGKKAEQRFITDIGYEF
jgi:hypothetical protein